MLSKTHEKATLYAPKGKATWLIIWSNINPATGKLERIRKTFNLNRIKDLAERKTIAYNLLAVLNEALANQWNAFTDEGISTPKKLPTCIEVFNRAYAVKTIGNSKSSLLSFGSIANIFREWMTTEGIAGRPINTFTAATFQKYISHRADQGLGARNINAHINLVRAVFSKMVKPLGILKENPLLGFDMLQEADSDLYQLITPQELFRIRRYLQEVDPGFFLFTQFIYYGLIRPAHVAQMRRGQLDFTNDLIQVLGSNTKSKRNATKQLLQPLKVELQLAGIPDLQEDVLLFTSGFKPGSKALATLGTRATERWNELVKVDLRINKLMYALKHTFATNYINENEQPDSMWLQRQMEHSSIIETEAYISKRKAKKIDERKVNYGTY